MASGEDLGVLWICLSSSVFPVSGSVLTSGPGQIRARIRIGYTEVGLLIQCGSVVKYGASNEYSCESNHMGIIHFGGTFFC